MAGEHDVDSATGEELQQPVETGDHEGGLTGGIPVYQTTVRGVESVPRDQDPLVRVQEAQRAGRVA